MQNRDLLEGTRKNGFPAVFQCITHWITVEDYEMGCMIKFIKERILDNESC